MAPLPAFVARPELPAFVPTPEPPAPCDSEPPELESVAFVWEPEPQACAVRPKEANTSTSAAD